MRVTLQKGDVDALQAGQEELTGVLQVRATGCCNVDDDDD